MTNPLTPLTSDELADLKAKIIARCVWFLRRESGVDHEYTYAECDGSLDVLRLIDMIERRDEQIEKLRGALSKCAQKLERCICAGGSDAEFAAIAISEFTAALAATEPTDA